MPLRTLRLGNYWKDRRLEGYEAKMGMGGKLGALPDPKRLSASLSLARFGGFLHLPLFGYHRDIKKTEGQDHH